MKTPTPKKTASGYRIQLRLNGTSIPVTAPTAKECIRQAELIKAEHRAEKRLVSKNNITLRQAIDNYIAARDGVLSPATIRGYRNIGKNRFTKYSDERIAKVDWQTAVNEEAKIINAKTLKNAWGFVSTVIQSCGVNPGKITLPQVVPNEHPWLTPEQIPTFLEAIKGKDAEIPALLALHGLRCSFASLCYHAGLTERETMKLGSWSDPGVMRKIYTHISEADSKKANEKLKDFFNSL